MFNLKCVYTLLIHSAFVLGTTPKGDTGGGPNWACKRDCPGSSNEHWSFCVRSITPSSDPFCAAGLQSPLWGFYKLVWDVDVKIFVSETWRLCSISVLSGITMSIDSAQAY